MAITKLIATASVVGRVNGRGLKSRLLVPRMVLEDRKSVFLSDVALSRLGRGLGARVHIIDISNCRFISTILNVGSGGLR